MKCPLNHTNITIEGPRTKNIRNIDAHIHQHFHPPPPRSSVYHDPNVNSPLINH